MASTSTSQRPKGHNGALSTLDVLIQVLTLAKDICGIPPAQDVFGSAVTLLAMIRVIFSPLCGNVLLILFCLGLYDGPTRLRRARNILWGCVPSPRQGVERETIG